MIVRDPRAEANATRGGFGRALTETIDAMPTILDWLACDPAQCDAAVLGFCEAPPPTGARGALRVRLPRPLYSQPKIGAGRADGQVLAGRRAGRAQVRAFAALPPLLFGPQGDRAVRHRAADRLMRATGRLCRQMLDWRLGFADRTLTG